MDNFSNYENLTGNHDLCLPDWGAYTKKYMGISHMADKARGIRFDLSVIPGQYRRAINIPNVMWESGYHPWEASAKQEFYVNRYEIEWKDNVYCDVSFSEVDENTRLCQCKFVNNTGTSQALVLHYAANINFPTEKPGNAGTQWPRELVPAKVDFEGIWINSMDYIDMRHGKTQPQDSLVYDGFRRGEWRMNGFVDGLGLIFGKYEGDISEYRFDCKKTYESPTLWIRYYGYKDNSIDTVIYLDGVGYNITLNGTGQIEEARINLPVESVNQGLHDLSIVSSGGADILIDGFGFTENDSKMKFIELENDHIPDVENNGNEIVLKYKSCDGYYGIKWDYPDFDIRTILNSELDSFLRYRVHSHTVKTLSGDNKDHYLNIFLRPITLEANSSKIINCIVCEGSKETVKSILGGFDFKLADRYYNIAREKSVKLMDKSLPLGYEGEKYLHSIQLMSATLMTNTVFPVYTKGAYIRHYTPGRWWDCLYTWDSGFIGIGLAQLNTECAMYCLNAYLTEPGDEQTAFIHHGSMVPVQFYLFMEIHNNLLSNNYINYFYPKLKQYYEFYVGRLGSSTTAKFNSGLLATWDYFYNSGGWDDYPPQVHVHMQKKAESIAPVSNTCHCIRIAKIMKFAAAALGLSTDVKQYEQDIQRLSSAVLENAWDEETGYFGYVCHDEQKEPIGILKYKDEINYNMGYDGIYPIVAGICAPEQEKRIIENMKSPDRIWTDTGLSTVDRTAPYYSKAGYWNGSVWMPHQWFFWKTMLDIGEGDFAHKIAVTALDVWKREVDYSYNCFEHFNIESGRGAGWHHFGGLSSPVIAWFKAYFTAGTLTAGFNIWFDNIKFSEDNTVLEASFKYEEQKGSYNIIAVMSTGKKYNVFVDGEQVDYKQLYDGTLQITLDYGKSGTAELVIK